MASSYSPNKNYELPNTGEQNNVWGITLNSNVFSVVDLNFGGRLALNCAGSSDVTLTSTQARNVEINCTGVLTGNISVIVPNSGSFYIVYNNTTGAFTLTVKPSGGTGIIVPQGQRVWMFANPTSGAMEMVTPPIVHLTPTQIAATTNDYAPTGYSNAVLWRLSSDASRNITGITANGVSQSLILANVGSFPIVLSNASASSTAANRFSFPVDYQLVAGATVGLVYDHTTARWRLPQPFARPLGVQAITATGTYTPTAGTTYAIVTCQAAGGGGGGVSNAAATKRGGGGGAGETRRAVVTITGTVSVTIGAIGAGGAAGNNVGGTAADTTFGASITAKGGTGGSGSVSGNGTDGSTPSGSGGAAIPTTAPATTAAGMMGGSCIWGLGAINNQAASQAGQNAPGKGGGGVGGYDPNTSTARAGGDGGVGYVLIEEYTS